MNDIWSLQYKIHIKYLRSRLVDNLEGSASEKLMEKTRPIQSKHRPPPPRPGYFRSELSTLHRFWWKGQREIISQRWHVRIVETTL